MMESRVSDARHSLKLKWLDRQPGPILDRVKAPEDSITEQDVQDLVAGDVQESLELDYKASAALKDPKWVTELSKDVSSFANSAGGTLIYGVEENAAHHPVRLDGGIDPSELDRERLENVILSNVRPRLRELVVRPIPLTTGHLLYLVSVRQGKTAHMAADHRYYKRFNFKAEPMEHYEVEDVMHRLTTPDLQLFMTHNLQALQRMAVEVFVQNVSPVPAEFFAVSVFIQATLQRKYVGDSPYTLRGPVDVQLADFTETFDVVTWQWYDRLPLFPGAPQRVGTFDANAYPGNWLLWEVHSTGSPNRGAIKIVESGLKDVATEWQERRATPRSI